MFFHRKLRLAVFLFGLKLTCWLQQIALQSAWLPILLASTKLELVFLFCKNTHFERLETGITILLFKKSLS